VVNPTAAFGPKAGLGLSSVANNWIILAGERPFGVRPPDTHSATTFYAAYSHRANTPAINTQVLTAMVTTLETVPDRACAI